MPQEPRALFVPPSSESRFRPWPTMHRLLLLGGASLQGPTGPHEGRAAQRRQLALLALLAPSPDRRVTREKLVGLMWPDLPEERARHLLSDTLYAIRQELGADAVVGVGKGLRLNPEVVWSDVVAFEVALEEGRPEEAVELYGGPFLDGFYLDGSGAFERWAEGERRRLKQRWRETLETLAEGAEARGDRDEAVRWWRRRAGSEPTNSRVAVRLMEALAAAGNRAGALAHAREHERVLRKELGVGVPAEVAEFVAGVQRDAVELPRGTEGGAPDGDRSPPRGAPPPVRRGGGPPVRSTTPAPGGGPPSPRIRLQRRVVGTVVLAVIVVAGWLLVGAGREIGDSGDGPPDRERSSIAVLPFENLSPDPDDAYFADGFHDEILTHLSRIGALEVISRNSVLEYRGTPNDIRAIAGQLGVRHILEGTVRRAGEEVRITAQLIDAETGEHLWADTYDRELSDIFAVQTDVAREIVRALDARLSPEEAERIEARPTADVEAYSAYLRGNDYFQRGHGRWNEHASAIARDMYARAVERDPSFAVAWKGLVQARVWLAWNFGRTEERARAREALDRLVQLDPDGDETHVARGYYAYWGEARFADALREFGIVAERRPGDAEVRRLTAYLHRRTGAWEAAARTMERLLELDPRNASVALFLGQTYARMRRWEDAERHLDRAIALTPDSHAPYAEKLVYVRLWGRGDTAAAREVLEDAARSLPAGDWGLAHLRRELAVFRRDLPAAIAAVQAVRDKRRLDHWILAFLHRRLGEEARSRSHADSLLRLGEAQLQGAVEQRWRRREAEALVTRARGRALLGRTEEAVADARRALELFPVSSDAFSGPSHGMAVASVMMEAGHNDEAVALLGELLEIPSPVNRPFLRMHVLWDPLRDHPGFQALLEEHR